MTVTLLRPFAATLCLSHTRLKQIALSSSSSKHRLAAKQLSSTHKMAIDPSVRELVLRRFLLKRFSEQLQRCTTELLLASFSTARTCRKRGASTNV